MPLLILFILAINVLEYSGYLQFIGFFTLVPAAYIIALMHFLVLASLQ